MRTKPSASLVFSISSSSRFLFLLFYPFSFSFLLAFFLYLISPLIPFSFSHFFSFLSFPPFFFSFTFSSFSPFSFPFSPPFWSTSHIRSKEEISSPFPLTKYVALNFPSLNPYFFISFMTSSTQVDHCEPWDHATHVAQCEPFLLCQVSHLLRCHVASPNLSMCHPTPHVSKNVKPRPPQN